MLCYHEKEYRHKKKVESFTIVPLVNAKVK